MNAAPTVRAAWHPSAIAAPVTRRSRTARTPIRSEAVGFKASPRSLDGRFPVAVRIHPHLERRRPNLTDAVTIHVLGWPEGLGPPFRRGYPPPKFLPGGVLKVRELSIFVDESGDLGPFMAHSPFYILSLVFHDQSDDISSHLDRIHQALEAAGLGVSHAVHTAPLIRREQPYRFLKIRDRRAIFRMLFNFVRGCEVTHHSMVFSKRSAGHGKALTSAMSIELETLITGNLDYFLAWDRILIYYDNGQKEISSLVESAFRAHVREVEFRKVSPSEYSLFQAADLFCTLALLRQKILTPGLGLSQSERDFFSTPEASAERALRKAYFKPMQRKDFSRQGMSR